ncbi:MAG: nickel pincer cofactor biosynthesis protein LarB [Planctomycetia bacterium]|nr:nickel pincer cofactor biosynthesis protein LarB [Planctomycetia bacterium]
MNGEMIDKTSLQGILFDHGRYARIGLPEAVFCEGKSRETLQKMLETYSQNTQNPILFTRLHAEIFESLPEEIQMKYDYHALSQTAYTHTLPQRDKGSVAVVSAGTADGRTTWEAARTVEYLGIKACVYEDLGVAGLWRIVTNIEKIASADVIIIVAGLDAALASVLGGLVEKPIFAVPTSVGYGVARGGETALASMLASCAPGIGVMNINNGYGAACAAARIMNVLFPVSASAKNMVS